MNERKTFRLTSSRVIVLGFAAVILLATIVLMLPISSADHSRTSFTDALFTSTSATCVTGLVTYNTAMHWSIFGKALILLLIQIGGMGVITVAIGLSMISGKRISLLQRIFMQDSISAPQLGGIIKFTGFIVISAFTVEIIGAVLLMPTLCGIYGAKGIWLSFFHSVSAFCNAGFDIMENGNNASSLMAFRGNIPVNAVIILLIIIGGIGFATWKDVKENGIKIKRYSLQSKVILITTLIFIFLPAIFFFIFEFKGFNTKDRVLASLFQSVTLRTAGFNTVDFSTLSDSSLSLMTVFMLIGGAPGSTAGGMKITTVVILLFSMKSVFLKQKEVRIGNRRINDENVKKAAAIFMMYIILFFAGGIAISVYENIPIQKCLFETASAIGTVGLSTGITASLSAFSKIVLITLMYFGRVGGLTMIFAAARSSNNSSKLPEEKIVVG